MGALPPEGTTGQGVWTSLEELNSANDTGEPE